MASVEAKVIEQINKSITNPLIVKYEAMKALNSWLYAILSLALAVLSWYIIPDVNES